MHDPHAAHATGHSQARPPLCGEDAADHAHALAQDDGRPAREAVDRVLFAIDFGAASLGAARWAVTNLARDDRSIAASVAHVVTSPDVASGADSDVVDDVMHRLGPALVGGLGGVAASLGLTEARSVLRHGRPSSVLGAIAEAEDVGVIVLGRRRDAARHRVGEPNVIERLTRRARRDVLVVPEGAPSPIAHVVAAVDASPYAPRVVERAAAIARDAGAALTIVHVLAPTHGSYERVGRSARQERDARDTGGARPSRALVARQDAAYGWLASLARGADPAVKCMLSAPAGDAARKITALASRHDGALIVLGKRGADDAPVGSIGSVTRELALRGAVPVLALESR